LGENKGECVEESRRSFNCRVDTLKGKHAEKSGRISEWTKRFLKEGKEFLLKAFTSI